MIIYGNGQAIAVNNGGSQNLGGNRTEPGLWFPPILRKRPGK